MSYVNLGGSIGRVLHLENSTKQSKTNMMPINGLDRIYRQMTNEATTTTSAPPKIAPA